MKNLALSLTVIPSVVLQPGFRKFFCEDKIINTGKNFMSLDKPGGRRRVGRPNLRWMDGVMRDAERLGVRNWRSKAKDRVGWRRLLESAKTLHGL
jgi:hypothetical protein